MPPIRTKPTESHHQKRTLRSQTTNTKAAADSSPTKPESNKGVAGNPDRRKVENKKEKKPEKKGEEKGEGPSKDDRIEAIDGPSQPVHILAVCRADDEQEDDWIVSDFLLYLETFRHAQNIKSQRWLMELDALALEKEYKGICHGDPNDERHVVDRTTIEAAINAGELMTVPRHLLRKKFLDGLEILVNTTGQDDNILIVICAHGLASDSTKTEGDLLVGGPKTGGQSYIKPKDLTKRMADSKARITIISTSCFAQQLKNDNYSLVAASDKGKSYSFSTSGSFRQRGGPFSAALVDALQDEFKGNKRHSIKTLFGLEFEVTERVAKLQPDHPIDPVGIFQVEAKFSSGLGLNIPPRLKELFSGVNNAPPSPYVVTGSSSQDQRNQAPATGSSSPDINHLIAYYRASNPPYSHELRMVERWSGMFEAGILPKHKEDDMVKFLSFNKHTNRAFNLLKESFKLDALPDIEKFDGAASREQIRTLRANQSSRACLPVSVIRSAGSDGIDARQAAYLFAAIEIVGNARATKALNEILEDLGVAKQNGRSRG